MDGLDCKEELLSTVKQNNYFFRLDSHCFEKRFEFLKHTLSLLSHKCLSELVSKPIQTGHTPSMSNAENYGGNIAFIKTDNLHSNDISDMYNDYLSDKGNSEIFRTFLQPKDIITTIIGATEDVIARSAMIYPSHLPANINQNIVQIRINSNIICPEYVNTYLNSKYGRNYLIYLSRQTEQVNLNCQEVGEVLVPIFSDNFCGRIETISAKAYEFQKQAKTIYTSAEKLLDIYLKVENFDKYRHTIKLLSKSFFQSGRLDAEYYQPKYDTLFETLNHFTIANLSGENGLVSIKKSIEPGSEAYQDEGIPFVRVSDINQYGIVAPAIKLSPTIIPDIENLYPCKDTILLSKDGSVGIAYKVQEDMQVVTSGALLHLTVKDTNQILPDYLTLVLNSQVVQLQAERDCNGAIIQHWKPSDIEKVLIPVLDMDKQKEISDKVQESFRLRKETKRLLDNAIKAVEMAIETDEKTALKCLDNQQTLCTNQNL